MNISENGILPTIGKRSTGTNNIDTFIHQMLTILSQNNSNLPGG